MSLGGDYLRELKKRSQESHVHKEFQLVGLEIADLLSDQAHKALYIKLAKQHPRPHDLLTIAKEVAGKNDVKRKGAYFMAIVTGTARTIGQSEIYRSKPPAKIRKTAAKKTKKNDAR
jgi:hypothetical protein